MKTLVVEDEMTSARVLSKALKEYGPVSCAPSPSEAFELYRKAIEDGQPFELICLDLELPEYDGLEFLDEIRKAEEERGIPLKLGTKVIITTGHCDLDTFCDAEQEGCDGFLCKPVDKSKLIAELKRLGLVKDVE